MQNGSRPLERRSEEKPRNCRSRNVALQRQVFDDTEDHILGTDSDLYRPDLEGDSEDSVELE